MKEIKTVETVEKIVGYEACDGRKFEDKEQCLKYEKTATAVITADFRKRVVNVMELIKITDEGAVPFCEIGEGWYVALVKIQNHDDLKVCNMFSQLQRNKNMFTEDMIGKSVFVSIGSGSGNGGYEFDNCWVYGTVEECVEKYRNALMKMFETKNESDGERKE